MSSDFGAVVSFFNARSAHEPTPMRCECSWCGTVIRPGSEPVSHSICAQCAAEHFPKAMEGAR